MSASGYVKTVSADEFRRQSRGGRGVAAAKLKSPDDTVTQLIHTTAHSYLLLFSNHGKVYRIKAHEVPRASRQARGTAAVNLLPMLEGERIQAVIDTRDYETNRYLFFATAKGRVKRTRFTAYDSSHKAGLIAIRLRDGDELVSVMPTDGVHDIMLSSHRGQTIRFSQEKLRTLSRNAAGVIGIKFKHEDDAVVSCAEARPGMQLLYVNAAGLGKRTPVDAFKAKGRAGRGVVGMPQQLKSRGGGSRRGGDFGGVVSTIAVDGGEEILAVASSGKVIRTAVSDISVQGRSAFGVKVMRLEEGDAVVAVTLVEEEDEIEGDGAGGADAESGGVGSGEF